MLVSRITPRTTRRHRLLGSSRVYHGIFSRLTKIVCTLGPSSDTQSVVDTLVNDGLTVARLNFSHVPAGSYNEPAAKMELVHRAPGIYAMIDGGHDPTNSPPPPNLRAVMVDTKGPEIRTKALPGNAAILELIEGTELILTCEDVCDDEPDRTPFRLAMDYDALSSTVTVGSTVLLDDGLIGLQVLEINVASGDVLTRVMNGGPIKANKGVNLPGCVLKLPALTAKDRLDLQWAVESGADAVAASFIRNGANVRSVIAHLERCCEKVGRVTRPIVISKIESAEGVEHFEEILRMSDGIMVARGDLGVEIPFEKVFAAQKEMVSRCNAAGKPVIVATQMLDSMQKNPRPTRAEVTDVGNAVLDGADAVMLSGETAAGKYPLHSLRAMRAIASEADALCALKPAPLSLKVPDNVTDQTVFDSVAASAVRSARDLNAKMIICITDNGKSARAVAKMRPNIPVLAFCGSAAIARQLQFYRAIYPMLLPGEINESEIIEEAKQMNSKRMGEVRAEALRTAQEAGWVSAGDRVIIIDRKQGHSTGKHMSRINLLVLTIGSDYHH